MAALYMVTAWLVMQIVAVAMGALELPDWFDGAALVLVAAGFPVALVIAWAFELTPEGVRRTAPASADAPAAPFARTDIVLIAALVAVLGATLFQALRAPAPGARPAAADDLSIAVLPFADMSPDGDQEYFSDGLSEELLNVLAQVDQLRVAGRTSSFAFKDRADDLPAIGAQLGVANILEGSVRTDGDRLRITAQLVSAEDGYHLWSETYDRRLDDVFAVQEEIALAVADALSVTLGVGERPRVEDVPENLEAYDLYLRARALTVNGSPADIAHASEILKQAIALDPDFTRARGGLAASYAMTLLMGGGEDPEGTALALSEAAADALAIAPDDWTARTAAALMYMQRYEWAEADAEFERAGALAPPTAVETHLYHTLMLVNVGRAEDAIALIHEKASSEPLWLGRSDLLQQALDMVGRRDEAEAEYRRTLDLEGDRITTEHLAFQRIWNDGDVALMRERYARYLATMDPPPPLFVEVGDVIDDPDAVLALLRAAHDQGGPEGFVGRYAAHFGDTALAFDAMRRAYLEQHVFYVASLWYPDMAAVRRMPEFKDLVREIGLVDYWRETGDWGDFCRPLGADDFECF